jgi:CheY-like chemotaxis protein
VLDRLAEEIRPTLVAVLSDINMPGMDGLELLGAIKRRRPELPVMMVTAYGDDERRRRAQELGAFGRFRAVESAATPIACRCRLTQLRRKWGAVSG